MWTEFISNLLGLFGRFLSKDSAKFEWNSAKVWATDCKPYLDANYLQLHLFQQLKFFRINQVI